MALTNLDAPFGLRPARLLGGGAYTGGQNRYEISNSDTTKIYQGDIVKGLATGYIKRIAAADGGLVLGVFNGCQFTDSSTGTPRWSKNQRVLTFVREESFQSIRENVVYPHYHVLWQNMK